MSADVTGRMEQCFPDRPDIYRIVLRQEVEGVYVFVYSSKTSSFPERDYLQDSVELAKSYCRDELGCGECSWEVLSEPPPGL